MITKAVSHGFIFIWSMHSFLGLNYLALSLCKLQINKVRTKVILV